MSRDTALYDCVSLFNRVTQGIMNLNTLNILSDAIISKRLHMRNSDSADKNDPKRKLVSRSGFVIRLLSEGSWTNSGYLILIETIIIPTDMFISYPRHNNKSKDEIVPSRYFAKFFNKK